MKNESVAQLFDAHKGATNLDSKQLQGTFRSLIMRLNQAVI